MAGGIIIALAASLVATLTGASDVRVASRDVRLSDVAGVRGPGAEVARQVVIARIRPDSETSVSRRDLAQLIRRAAPGVDVAGDITGSVVLRSAHLVQAPAAMKPYVVEAAVIERGQKLILTATAGPVVIERRVVALQDGQREAKRLFVRTEDGKVFSAPLRAGAAQ